MSNTDPACDSNGFKITIDDLIKANIMQKAIAEATIEVLTQAKQDKALLEEHQKELKMLYQKEALRLNNTLKKEIE